MIKANGRHIKAAGESASILAEASMILYAVCAQLANEKADKYWWLDKIYSSVKEEMEREDGIGEGGGSDA